MHNYITSRRIYSTLLVMAFIGLPALFVWDKYFSRPAINGSRSDDSKASVPIEKFGSTSLWFEQSFWDGKNQIHAIFTETPRVDEIYNCHVCGAMIGVVTYKHVDGGWEFVSMQPQLTEYGQWGSAPEVNQAKLLQLAPDNVAFMIYETSLNQGYYTSWADILAYSKNKWQDLGSVEIGVVNDGDCSDPPPSNKNEEDYGRCWSYKGEVSVRAGKNPQYSDLLITQTGTERGKDKMHVVPVNRVITYIFNGEKYIESEAAHNASKFN